MPAHETGGLEAALALLVSAVVFVPLAVRLKIGSILGYLGAGALIGPWGLGLIEDVESVRHLAEFGVVFLLFIIGIEMKPSRLWLMRRQVFGLGGLQVALTGGCLAAVLLFVPFLKDSLPISQAILVGLGLSLSSTAMGLQILAERRELSAAHGRTAFAVLLLQDLMVPMLLAAVPLLATSVDEVGSDLVIAAAEAFGMIAAALVLGRLMLRRVLRVVALARSAEIFTAVALLIVLGMAWVSEHAGLSQALGAFLAGLLLADSEYRHQIEGDIQPFRGLLLGLFFIGVGMSIDLSLLKTDWLAIMLCVLGLVSIKAILLVPLSRLFGQSWRDSCKAAVLLSQGGEFAFVLFGIAAAQGVIPYSVSSLLLLSVSLSMACTPLLVILTDLGLKRFFPQTAPSHTDAPPRPRGDQAHVIIAGFGRVGRTIATVLRAAGKPYLAFDQDLERVVHARSAGFEVFYGDASRPEVLRAGHAEHAALLVVTLDDPSATTRLIARIHQQFPDLPIHARARDLTHSLALQNSGAAHTVPETLEASLVLADSVLSRLGVSAGDIGTVVSSLRDDGYATLRKLGLTGAKLG